MKNYMSDQEAKRAIVEYGRRIYERGMVASNDGNITIKVADNAVWATPTGVSKGYMTEDMLIKMDLDGNVLTKNERKPSSEIKMHLRVYKEDPDVMAVCHAHPLAATAFSIKGETFIPDILAEPVFIVGEIPAAPFAFPGTYEVPDSIAPFVKDHNVALLGNHGALAWGDSIEEAFFRLDSLEHFCRINLISKYIIKDYKPIPQDAVDKILADSAAFKAAKRAE